MQGQPGDILCLPLPGSQSLPFPGRQMAWPNFGGSQRETPVDFSGSWMRAKVNFLCKTLFPAMELLRQSLSPWFLKYCWYQKVNTLQNYCLPIARASPHFLLCSPPSFLTLTLAFTFYSPNKATCWLMDISTADSRREGSKADFPDLLNVSA